MGLLRLGWRHTIVIYQFIYHYRATVYRSPTVYSFLTVLTSGKWLTIDKFYMRHTAVWQHKVPIKVTNLVPLAAYIDLKPTFRRVKHTTLIKHSNNVIFCLERSKYLLIDFLRLITTFNKMVNQQNDNSRGFFHYLSK